MFFNTHDIRFVHLRKATLETLGKGGKHGRRVTGVSNLDGVTLAYGVLRDAEDRALVYWGIANPLGGENFNRDLGRRVAYQKVYDWLEVHKDVPLDDNFETPVGGNTIFEAKYEPHWDRPHGLASYVIQQYLAALQSKKLKGFMRYRGHVVIADAEVIQCSLRYMKARQDEMAANASYTYTVTAINDKGEEC